MMPPLAVMSTSAARNSALCAKARVLIALTSHADDNGRCFPSVPTLAEETGLHERTVQRATAGLVDDGLIEIEPRIARQGDAEANVYIILGHAEAVAILRATRVVATLPPPPGKDATRVVATVATRVVAQRATHNTSLNRPFNKEDARVRVAPDGRARAHPETDVDRARLFAYQQNGYWPPEWGAKPSWLDEGGVVMDVEEEEDVETGPIPELRETGS